MVVLLLFYRRISTFRRYSAYYFASVRLLDDLWFDQRVLGQIVANLSLKSARSKPSLLEDTLPAVLVNQSWAAENAGSSWGKQIHVYGRRPWPQFSSHDGWRWSHDKDSIYALRSRRTTFPASPMAFRQSSITCRNTSAGTKSPSFGSLL